VVLVEQIGVASATCPAEAAAVAAAVARESRVTKQVAEDVLEEVVVGFENRGCSCGPLVSRWIPRCPSEIISGRPRPPLRLLFCGGPEGLLGPATARSIRLKKLYRRLHLSSVVSPGPIGRLRRFELGRSRRKATVCPGVGGLLGRCWSVCFPGPLLEQFAL